MVPAIAQYYAELAQKAYDDEIQIKGFKSTFISRGGTQLHILQSDAKQLVIFRGTEKDAPEDILTDLKAIKETTGSGGIHAGFNSAFKDVLDPLYEEFSVYKDTTFIGHSLGGALALIAGLSLARELSASRQIITFGCPHVYDKNFVNLNKNEFLKDKLTIRRFENAYDPVPFVAPYMCGWRHIGEYYYLKNNKAIYNPYWFTPAYDQFSSSIKMKKKAHSIQTYIDNLKGLSHD
ncbi:MAG: lipase family protein [Lentisphaeraceae bacterium]|nr:lipase family protein [Lentisphaeraceae bacterium]